MDYYAAARKVAHALEQQGLTADALSLRDVIESGSTASEILMGLRWNLQRILTTHPAIRADLRSEIETLSRSIESALKP